LCSQVDARKRAVNMENNGSFEWQHGGVTYREYVVPVMTADYEGTELPYGAWRLGVVVK
jgi:hypothetical protein